MTLNFVFRLPHDTSAEESIVMLYDTLLMRTILFVKRRLLVNLVANFAKYKVCIIQKLFIEYTIF